jgi:hypothetical protein
MTPKNSQDVFHSTPINNAVQDIMWAYSSEEFEITAR